MMTKYDITVLCLKHIAKRLSGRNDCRNVAYKVSIQSTLEGYQMLSISPNVHVYPNKHRRKRSDMHSILSYVMHELNIECNELTSGRIVIKYEPFINGLFEYKLSFDNKYRAWFKLN